MSQKKIIKRPLQSTVRGWIDNYPEISLQGSELFCEVCKTLMPVTKKSHFIQHVKSKTHLKNLNKTPNFNSDLTEVMVKCNIPWRKLNNPVLCQFLQKCINGVYGETSVPDESTLRKNYLKPLLEKVRLHIRESMADHNIWVSADETTDVRGRMMLNIIVGILRTDVTSKNERYLIASTELEATNAHTVSTTIENSLINLWGNNYDANVEKVMLFVSDGASYMLAAGKKLSNIYPNILHVTCLAHALHRLAETVRISYPEVNMLISSIKQIFLKSPQRIHFFKENLPHVPLPPQPIITRWGTWLEAASYYYTNYNNLKRIIDMLPEEDAASISNAKQIFKGEGLLHDLQFIHSHFHRLTIAIRKLENTHLSLQESLNEIFEIRQYFYRCNEIIDDKDIFTTVRQKICDILNRNPGFLTLCAMVKLMTSGEEVDFSQPGLNIRALRHYQNFTYAPITSVDCERSFSTLKWILDDRRHNLTPSHLEAMLLINYNQSGFTTDCSSEDN